MSHNFVFRLISSVLVSQDHNRVHRRVFTWFEQDIIRIIGDSYLCHDIHSMSPRES